MNELTLTRWLGAGRIAIGLTLVATPRAMTSVTGTGSSGRVPDFLTRALGGRDVFVGVVGVAMSEPRPAAAWLALTAVVDANDAAWMSKGRKDMAPAAGALAVLTAAAAALEVTLAKRLWSA